MHDTMLLDNIRKNLEQICKKNCIERVNKLKVSVSLDSHVNSENLYKHLNNTNKTLVGEWSEILIEKRENLESQTAIIESIQGEFKE
ncbi:hypothetical protein [Hathewaya massiliensis]|uniref:hypothetical protein n=1 Tax=Hathewaya massiliensis TaxID=1964382 RepID=UPI00115B4293|nr:hypothetical protein [Hathewaya massiliensis]